MFAWPLDGQFTRMNHTNFVNEARNVVWLSGYPKVIGGGELLLRQSANEDRAIPIHIGSMRPPRQNTPCEIKCHAYGYRDAAGRQWVRLEAIQIKRASVTATSRRVAALNALRPREALAAPDYSPFISFEKLRQEVRDSLKLDAEVVEKLLTDASKRATVRDGFQNKVILSGFIGHRAFIPPSDDGSGDLGHILFHLQQHADPERGIAVRINGADARFQRELKIMHPVNVIAEARVHVEKDDAGEVTARHVYLVSDRNNIGFATINDFAQKAWPDWWRLAVSAYYEQRRELAERSRQQASAAQQPETAIPSGVTVDSEAI